jgi:hypothetical protein
MVGEPSIFESLNGRRDTVVAVKRRHVIYVSARTLRGFSASKRAIDFEQAVNSVQFVQSKPLELNGLRSINERTNPLQGMAS